MSDLWLDDQHMVVVSFPLPAPIFEQLSESEDAVARGLLAGMSNAEIASARGRSIHTIANQVASIFQKLGVRSRAELAVLAARRSQIEPARRA